MTTATRATFSLSIEPTEGSSFLYAYHLGTDEQIARHCAEEVFANRKWFAGHGRVTVCTVALMREGEMVDCYDGMWASDIADELAAYGQFDCYDSLI